MCIPTACYWWTEYETNDKRHWDFPSSKDGFCCQYKEISPNFNTEGRVSRGASRFNFDNFVFIEEKVLNVQKQEMSINYSENLIINFRVYKTDRYFVFHNSDNIGSPNELSISATTEDRSNDDTQVTQQKKIWPRPPRRNFSGALGT